MCPGAIIDCTYICQCIDISFVKHMLLNNVICNRHSKEKARKSLKCTSKLTLSGKERQHILYVVFYLICQHYYFSLCEYKKTFHHFVMITAYYCKITVLKMNSFVTLHRKTCYMSKLLFH